MEIGKRRRWNRTAFLRQLKRYPRLYQALRFGNLTLRKCMIRMGKPGRTGICLFDCLLYYKKLPDLKNPKTIGEKIQWIKLNYENPLYTRCADKILARDYVKEKLSGGVVCDPDSLFPKLYRIYDRPEEIRLSELPDKFVLKPNHSSNKVILCTEKRLLDEGEVVKTAKRWVRENFYYYHGEWQYKDIVPRIICEELLEEDIVDYRIFCFDGKPKVVRTTRHDKKAPSGYTANFYDTDWREEGCLLKGDRKGDFKRPERWEDMLKIAEKLAEDFFFVRVDLYESGGRVYFAELTFTSHNGLLDLIPDRYNRIFGDMIHLPEK